MFERGAPNENFEEGYSERPNVGFPGVVGESTGALRGEILEERLSDVDNVNEW